MRRTLGCGFILTLFFIAGCVSYLQTKFAYSDKMYAGPYKTRNQIVVLIQNESQKVHIEKIDGSMTETELGVVFELLPGRHILCVRLSRSHA